MKNLLERIDNKQLPFYPEVVLKDYEIYLNLKQQLSHKHKNEKNTK